MENTDKTSAKIKLPGRLGNDEMTLRTDPRTDPRMLDGLVAVGLDGRGDAPPVTLDSPLDQLFEFISGMELFFQKVIQDCFADLPPVNGVVSRTETILSLIHI